MAGAGAGTREDLLGGWGLIPGLPGIWSLSVSERALVVTSFAVRSTPESLLSPELEHRCREYNNMALNVDIQPLKEPPGMVAFLCHHVWRKVTESGKFCGILIHSTSLLVQVDELPLHLVRGGNLKIGIVMFS